MPRLMLAALLLLSSLASAEEQKPPEDAKKPETHVISEKELVDDDGYVVRASLPTESDYHAWSLSGLRIALAYGHGNFWGNGTSVDLTLNALTIRAITRLDDLWSVGLDFQYARATGSISGLRFGSTLQVMLHPWRQLGIAVGTGYGGLVLAPTRGVPARPGNGEEVASTTFGPDAKLGACTGGAWVGLARVEYLFVVGQLFATGPYLEADAQLTQCQQTLGRVDRETGNPIYARQWWLQEGAVLGWWFTWR